MPYNISGRALRLKQARSRAIRLVDRVLRPRDLFHRVCPRERFLDPAPPPINFVHDHLFFSKFIIIYFFVIKG